MASDAERLDQIRQRVADVLRRDPNWQLLTDDFPWMDAAINRLLAVNARLTALLAERDAEVARLVGVAQAYIDAYDAALKAPLQYAQAEEYCHAQRYNLRAAVAARGVMSARTNIDREADRE